MFGVMVLWFCGWWLVVGVWCLVVDVWCLVFGDWCLVLWFCGFVVEGK